MEIINFKNYSFTYGGKSDTAIENINISIDKGQFILIAGDSGSGKTTFVRSLNGLIPEITEGILEGERYLTGKNVNELPIYEISRKIGSVFQNPRSQFFTLEVESELVFSMENYGFTRKQMEDEINKVNKMIPLDSLKDKKISQLSSGERQILALASVLTLGPDILLFDEPSANLDYRNAMKLKKILAKFKKQGKTILIADHRYFYMNGLVDKVLLFENGKARLFNSESEFCNGYYHARSFNIFESVHNFEKRKNRAGKVAARVENVSKWDVLKEMSMSVQSGEVTVMLGANGAGKTTLSKLLTKSIRPDSGSVQVSNQAFSVMQDADFQLFGTSTYNELEIGCKKLSDDVKDKVLKRLGLWEKRNAHPFELSGGEKQRLQIAVASLSDSDLIIFDEPTSGLDIKSMERVTNEIKDLSVNKAVFVITHDYEFVCAVADRVLYLKGGKVQEDFKLDSNTIPLLNKIYIDMEDWNE